VTRDELEDGLLDEVGVVVELRDVVGALADELGDVLRPHQLLEHHGVLGRDRVVLRGPGHQQGDLEQRQLPADARELGDQRLGRPGRDDAVGALLDTRLGDVVRGEPGEVAWDVGQDVLQDRRDLGQRLDGVRHLRVDRDDPAIRSGRRVARSSDRVPPIE
jgi:hypothetical protein